MNCLDAFYFDNYPILDDQNDAVTQFDPFSVEYHRKPDLASHLKAAFSEFMGETALIGALQQPRPKNGVDVHRAGDDRARNLIDSERPKRRSRRSHPIYISQFVGFTL